MSSFGDLLDAVKRGDLEIVESLLDANVQLLNQRDESGATALHHAAFHGYREMVRLIVNRGAEVNSIDTQFGATPAGWAIEYIRELGGYLATDLDDLAYAIRQGDAGWVRPFLERFPDLRHSRDKQGKPFRQLAEESNSQEIRELFNR